MEIADPIDYINKQLVDMYGIDSDTSQPIWRVVFSDDQFEKRLGTYEDRSPAGLYIRTVTEVRLVPKYRQWIQGKYILERLVVVPDFQADELPTSKMSYENLWTFEDKNGNYLPPKLSAAKFIVDLVYAAQYRDHSLAKYRDPDGSQEELIENTRKRVDGLVEELFGEQSSLEGSTVTGETIIVPRNFERGN